MLPLLLDGLTSCAGWFVGLDWCQHCDKKCDQCETPKCENGSCKCEADDTKVRPASCCWLVGLVARALSPQPAVYGDDELG